MKGSDPRTNRRFAPSFLALKTLTDRRNGPLILDYRVNAGKLPLDHWVLGPRGGGRLIGEGCHMIDLMGHLVGAARRDHTLQVLCPAGDREKRAQRD